MDGLSDNELVLVWDFEALLVGSAVGDLERDLLEVEDRDGDGGGVPDLVFVVV